MCNSYLENFLNSVTRSWYVQTFTRARCAYAMRFVLRGSPTTRDTFNDQKDLIQKSGVEKLVFVYDWLALARLSYIRLGTPLLI